jgi:uncharacterized protein
MQYEWDSHKEEINIKKHRVSFSDAKEALTCGNVMVFKEDNENDETRYIFMGISKKLNVLVVVVAFPEEEITRIISARKANKKERFVYETQL